MSTVVLTGAPRAPVTINDNGVTDVYADNTPYFYNHVGPTLLAGDNISNINNLHISDSYGFGFDIIPAGVILANIGDIILTTANNAGASGQPFDTSIFSGIGTVTVTSSGGTGTDYINAGPTTAIIDNQFGTGGGSQISGGSNVTVTSRGSGGVIVGTQQSLGNVPLAGETPTGAVSVTEEGTGNVAIMGGTAVFVDVTQASWGAEVSIGNTVHNTGDSATGGVANPTGPIVVADSGDDNGGFIRVFGGSSVLVSALGDAVTVGSNESGYNALLNNTTGNITVVNEASTTWTNSTGSENDVYVRGGANILVVTNTGGVYVGDTYETTNVAGTAPQPGVNPTGNVVVVDTATAETNGDTEIEVYGGVNVIVAASGVDVTVGNDNGTVAFVPTGTVLVTDFGPSGYDGILNTFNETVNVEGGTTVTVFSQSGGVYIGSTDAAPGLNPTGNVLVEDFSTGFGGGNYSVGVLGGANVTVYAQSGSIGIGDGTGGLNPTGAVVVAELGVNTGYQYFNNIFVGGGTNVTVVSTGANDGITVGSDIVGGGSPVTGAVNIYDLYSGRHHDSITVVGGTTVNITNTASTQFGGEGTIDVGAFPTLNGAGTAITNLADDPTGTVQVDDASIFGSKLDFGTENFNIYTNGSAVAYVEGGAGPDNIIEDVQASLSGTGTPIGTSKLQTVILDGVIGDTFVTTDALAFLDIANTPKGGFNDVFVTDNTMNVALTVNLLAAPNSYVFDDEAVFGTGLGGTGNGYIGSLLVNGLGTSPSDIGLDTPKVTLLAFNAAASTSAGPALTFDASISDVADVQKILVSGAGSVWLANLSGNTALTTIDASKNSGGVKVEIEGPGTSFTGGSGNNTLIVDTTATAFGIGTQNGGSGGTNTLVLTNTAASYLPVFDPTGAISGYVTNFQILRVEGGASGHYNAAGFATEGVASPVTGGDIFFDNVGSTDGLQLTAAPGVNVTVTPASVAPPTNTLNLTLGRDVQSFQFLPTKGIDFTSGGANEVNISGTSTLNVASLGTGKGTNTETVNDTTATNSALKTISISGDEALKLNVTGTIGTGGVTTITVAAADTKAVDVTGVTDTSTKGVTFTGGGGMLTAQGDQSAADVNTANDVFTTGAGGGTYTVGYGGAAGLGGGTSPVNPNGSETVNLGASAGVTDTLKVNDSILVVATQEGVAATINGFVATVSPNSDVIQYGTTKTELANGTYTVGGDTYQASNGVLSLTGGTPALTTELADVESIVNTAGTNVVAMFVKSGNTYVIASDSHTTDDSDSQLVLTGVSATQIGGGGGAPYNTAPANNAVIIDNVNLNLAPTVGALGVTVDETGFALAFLDAPGTAAANATTTTFNNLAASGLLFIANTNGSSDVHMGNIVVNQAGSAGGDSLQIDLGSGGGSDTTLDTLTVSNDASLTINNNFGNDNAITSLVDATNTVQSIFVVDGGIPGGSITIGGITDTALKTVDASGFSGDLTLTANQAGLSILGSTGGFNLTANGAADSIAVGTDTHPANTGDNVYIQAGGAGDHIAVIGGDTVEIGAPGAGDVITVANEGYKAYLQGNENAGINTTTPPAVSLGAGDTINVGDNTYGADAHMWLGPNSTVNINTTGGSSFADIHLLGDTAGASLTNMEVINGVDTGGGLRLHFNDTNSPAITTESWSGGNSVYSQVNVASASTLLQAENLAASQALVQDQQFNSGSNTTVLNQNAPGAVLQLDSHTGLVDWFQYGGNTYVEEAVNATNSAAAHPGLAANDIVVELTGLVDVNHISVALA